MSDLWYYAKGNEAHGPTTLGELIEALSRLSDPRKVLVWNSSLDDWKPAEGVSEIAEKMFRPPPLKIDPPPLPSASPIREPTVDAAEVSEIKITDPALTGIGGWLVLVAIGQVVGVIKLLGSLSQYYSALDSKLFQQFPLAAYGELAINIGLVALFIYTAIIFFRRSRNFPRFFIYQWIALIFTPLIATVWVGATLSSSTGQPFSAFAKFEPNEVGASLGAAIGAAIWISYILKSRRVANTFTR